MNLNHILDPLRSCPCGRSHSLPPMAVEIAPGLLARAAEILASRGFPRALLVVADKNTLRASQGILDILAAGGFRCELKLFDDLRVADMRDVEALVQLCEGVGGPSLAYTMLLAVPAYLLTQGIVRRTSRRSKAYVPEVLRWKEDVS